MPLSQMISRFIRISSLTWRHPYLSPDERQELLAHYVKLRDDLAAASLKNGNIEPGRASYGACGNSRRSYASTGARN